MLPERRNWSLARLGVPGWLAALIGFSLLTHLLFAASTGLGIDESYMVASGRVFRLGYFDHPPIAWWLAWLAAHLVGTDAAFIVRLPFVLLFSLSTWLMFRLAADLFDARTGLWAAVLLNLVPVLSVAAGTWVVPDGPLMAALLGAGVCFVRALRSEPRHSWGWWLGTGMCFGLALCSKYTAILTGAGAALYLLTQPRDRLWLARLQPYVAALLAFAMFAPVLSWNATHGWASLLFQGGRADGGRWHPFGPIATLAGEALYFMPWLWVALMLCIWRVARAGRGNRAGWLLVCLAAAPILLFEIVSLRGYVLYHWAAPGTMLALPLLANWIARRGLKTWLARLGVAATLAVMIFGPILIGTEVSFNWLPWLGENFAMGRDPDIQALDWTALRTALGRRGNLHRGAIVGATGWRDAGKIDYALGGAVPVICLGADPHEYGLSAPASGHLGADILIVAPHETLASIRVRFGARFDAIDPLPPVLINHAGRPAMLVPIFFGHRLRGAAPGLTKL